MRAFPSHIQKSFEIFHKDVSKKMYWQYLKLCSLLDLAAYIQKAFFIFILNIDKVFWNSKKHSF